MTAIATNAGKDESELLIRARKLNRLKASTFWDFDTNVIVGYTDLA